MCIRDRASLDYAGPDGAGVPSDAIFVARACLSTLIEGRDAGPRDASVNGSGLSVVTLAVQKTAALWVGARALGADTRRAGVRASTIRISGAARRPTPAGASLTLVDGRSIGVIAVLIRSAATSGSRERVDARPVHAEIIGTGAPVRALEVVAARTLPTGLRYRVDA